MASGCNVSMKINNVTECISWSSSVCSVGTGQDTTYNNAICCCNDIKSESIHADKEIRSTTKDNDYIANWDDDVLCMHLTLLLFFVRFFMVVEWIVLCAIKFLLNFACKKQQFLKLLELTQKKISKCIWMRRIRICKPDSCTCNIRADVAEYATLKFVYPTNPFFDNDVATFCHNIAAHFFQKQ